MRPDLRTLIVLLFASVSATGQDNASIGSKLQAADDIYSSNPDSSFTLCCEAEEDAQKLDTYDYSGRIATCKARYYLLVTDYENASAELGKAIQYYNYTGDFKNLARAYSLKSILLDRIGETGESSRYLNMAYTISRSHGDRQGEITYLQNMTVDFIGRDQPDSAYFYLLRLIELEPYIENTERYYLEQNQGMYYQHTGDHSKAIYYFLRAKKLSEEHQMLDSRATVLVLLAKSYRELGMLADAEKYALESYQVSDSNHLVYEKRDAVLELAAIYETGKNFALAFDFQKKLHSVDEEINRLEKIQKVKENEYYLALAEKEKEVAQSEYSLQTEKLKAAKADARNITLYFVVGIVLLVLSFTIFIYLRTRKLNHAIYLSKIILEQKNKEIIDSITYAKRIQDAILPPRNTYQRLFGEVFVMYRPKDIVAGDFYWFTEQGDNIFFAVADCTGHGVPGAMVSVICHGALERSVKEFSLHTPAEILEKTSELVIETFIKSEREVKDGMDIALCVLNRKTRCLSFAGANNSVWIVKKQTGADLLPANLSDEMNTLFELRGDKRPIGHSTVKRSFTNQEIILEKGDSVYMSTDGYLDQFGGEKGKKFKSKAFKEKLLQLQVHELTAQHEMIVQVFDRWKGDLEQVDDVCVMGVKI